MQSERHNATYRGHPSATEGHTTLGANRHTKPDTRRFATIFPLEVPEANPVDSGDTTHEEQDDSDDFLRFKFIAAFDENASSTQVASVASVDEGSTLSAAQQIIACYRGVQDSNCAPECSTTENEEKELPRIPDDQGSMYTLAASADTQSTMDMMWRPKPKVHMRRTDQRALMQAQSQAIAMMHGAGLKPTNKIQCRRRGCADILSNVEALKYHLHIHNIADSAGGCCSDPSSSTKRKTSVVERSTSNPRALKRNHSRSKSSHGTQHKSPPVYPLPRKLSAGSLLPSLFSPRESTLEVAQVPSLTTIAKAFYPDVSPKQLVYRSVRSDETPTPTSTPSHGQRKRKESMAVSVDAECSSSPGISMLLSPPSSPIMRGRLVLTPHARVPMPAALGPAKDSEDDTFISFPNESAHPVPEQLTGSRSPARALSPARAMSPIRNGIKRILAIGNVTDQ